MVPCTLADRCQHPSMICWDTGAYSIKLHSYIPQMAVTLKLFAVKAFFLTCTLKDSMWYYPHSMVCLDNQTTSSGTDVYTTKFLKNVPVYLHNIHTTDPSLYLNNLTFKTAFFCNVKPSNLVGSYQNFTGTCCFHQPGLLFLTWKQQQQWKSGNYIQECRELHPKRPWS